VKHAILPLLLLSLALAAAYARAEEPNIRQ
jgi:hypothetical protein